MRVCTRSSRKGAVQVQAVAAEPATAGNQQLAPGSGIGFYTGTDGYLYCDSMRVDDIRSQVPESPFYLYRYGA